AIVIALRDLLQLRPRRTRRPLIGADSARARLTTDYTDPIPCAPPGTAGGPPAGNCRAREQASRRRSQREATFCRPFHGEPSRRVIRPPVWQGMQRTHVVRFPKRTP